jgi:hypothetical protein
MAEEKRCDQCQHWDRDNKENVYTPGMTDVRKCNRAGMFWDVTEWSDDGARAVKAEHKDDQMFVQDGSDYYAFLLTRAGFYCASFKEAEGSSRESGTGAE